VSPTAGSAPTTGFDLGSNTMARYIAWGALGICSLLAVFALIHSTAALPTLSISGSTRSISH